jgi:hypothetical protein
MFVSTQRLDLGSELVAVFLGGYPLYGSPCFRHSPYLVRLPIYGETPHRVLRELPTSCTNLAQKRSFRTLGSIPRIWGTPVNGSRPPPQWGYTPIMGVICPIMGVHPHNGLFGNQPFVLVFVCFFEFPTNPISETKTILHSNRCVLGTFLNCGCLYCLVLFFKCLETVKP